jgi:hypothetical protein
MTHPVVFISYSHKDESEKDRLLSHLSVLQREGLISLWSDDIAAGADWKQEIGEAMAQARVAILLISANFLTSNFILGKEVPILLKQRQSEGLIIFPVIVRACAWTRVDWLTRMNVRPKNGRPIWGAGNRRVDEDLAAIAKEVAAIVESRPKIFSPTPRFAQITPEMARTISEFKYDIFVSYNHQDREWVHGWLMPKLEEAGLNIWIDVQEPQSDDSLTAKMERAITQSRIILIVLTPRYLSHQWVDFENILVQMLDPAVRQRRVIPLMLKPCELPSRIRALAYADFTRSDQVDFQLSILLDRIGIEETPSPIVSYDKSTIQTVDYDLKAIRNLLMAALVDEELTILCFDHFQMVYDGFSTGMSKAQKIYRLIEYCERHQELEHLLTLIKQANPAQYSRFEHQLTT